MKGYQQGDVLLICESLPHKGLTIVPPKARGYVLAEGEHTGHAHVLAAEPEIELYEDEKGVLWLRTHADAEITHEEHRPQTIPTGEYRIGRVVEVDPFTEEIGAVRD